ncbi:MAG: DUF1049 domain-containing protein, partial [Deltaproteobacteria bacterium]|nr:DUF1049 domain-containing protein [Deltaproteobacteria bacterium]
MSSRLVKLFGFFALVVVLSYIYVLNPSDVTVNISRSRAWVAPLALVLITTFSLGIFVTALIGFFIGARVSFQHWRERKRFQQVEEHHRRLERIREELVSENWDRACGALKRVIDEDPENVVARSMYAEALCRMKHFNEAFMVLDEARASFADNRELPILAARIHMERGNYTAALDNFAIVLKGDPDNQYALRNAKICAAKLGQYQHAVSFIERLARVA